MKQLLVLTIVSLMINPFAVFAQGGKQISEKEFTSDLDAYVCRTMDGNRHQ